MMISGVISIVITWFILFVIFCGIGLSIQRLFGVKNQGVEFLLSAFWVGWAYVIMMQQIWHLLAPVDLKATVCVLILGMAGAIWNRDRFAQLFVIDMVPKIKFSIVMCLFALLLANRAMGGFESFHGDQGLYHLSVIQWGSSYPIIPGLGNLHFRLAFNNSYFLYLSLLDVSPWTHMSNHIGIGLLLFVFSLQIGLSVSKVIRNSNRVQTYDIFRILLIIPVLYYYFRNAFDPSPDIAVILLSMLIGIELCKLLFISKYTKSDVAYGTFFIIALSAIGISIKLSFIIIGCASSFVALGKYLVCRFDYNTRDKTRKEMLWILGSLILVLVPWTARGVILSGYAAFPSVVPAFNVEWKIPPEKAVYESKKVRSWARQPKASSDEVLASWRWLLPWLKRSLISRWLFNFWAPLFLSIIGFAMEVYRRNIRDPDFVFDILFLLPAFMALVFWFFMAPDPRFIVGAIWYLGAGSLAVAFRRYGLQKYPKVLTSFLKASFGVAILICGGLLFLESKRSTFAEIVRLHGFGHNPKTELSRFVTTSGLTLYSPDEKGLCWWAELPCTPYPKANLRLRKNGDIKSGFLVSPNE